MATWSEFAEAEPEMAALGLRLLEKFHLAYLATVRADGSPRALPVSPFIVDGRIVVATPRTSPKARDQLRDGRYVLHMLPGADDDEFRIRGRARSIGEGLQREQIFREGPHYLRDDDYIFEYEIAEVATAYWVDVGKPGTYPVRCSWRSTAPVANNRLKVVWRFNLVAGIEPSSFFAWLRDNVWASSAKYGCTTRAFTLTNGAHAYSTEATWPDAAARDVWQASDDFRAIPNYPGLDSPWAAQVDLEPVLYGEITR